MSNHISHKDTNKVIRAALREAFPGVKFSVAGSDHISTDITWTDGPAAAAVKAVAGRYCSSKGLDPSGDYTETGDSVTDRAFTATAHDGTTTTYSPGDTVYWGPTYVFVHRELSDQALEAGWDQLEDLMGCARGTLDRKGELTGNVAHVEVFAGVHFRDYTLRAGFVAHQVAERLATAAYTGEPASAREAENAREAAAEAEHREQHLTHPGYPAEFGGTCRWCATPAREAAYAAAGAAHITEHIGAEGYPGAHAQDCGWCQDAAEQQDTTTDTTTELEETTVAATAAATDATADDDQRAALWHQNVHCNDPGYPGAYAGECERCRTDAAALAAVDTVPSAALDTTAAAVTVTGAAAVLNAEHADQERAALAAAAAAAGIGIGTAVAWTTRQRERTVGTVTGFQVQGPSAQWIAVLEVDGNPLGVRAPLHELRTVVEDAAWRAEAASYRAHHGEDAAARAAGWADQAGAFADAAETCAEAAATDTGAYAGLRLYATAARTAAEGAAAAAAAADTAAEAAAESARLVESTGMGAAAVTAARAALTTMGRIVEEAREAAADADAHAVRARAAVNTVTTARAQ